MSEAKISRRKYLKYSVAGAAALAAAAAGGVYYQKATTRRRSIKIGLVAPFSLPEGPDMERATKLAIEEINSAGGVYVKEWGERVPMEYVIADDEDASPEKGVTAVTRAIVEDKVDLLVGAMSSRAALAEQVPAIKNRVPFIITGASTHLVTRRGPQGNYGGLPPGDPLRIEDAEGMSYMFHYCTTTFHYSKTVMHFFGEYLKPMVAPNRNFRLAILYRDDAYGVGVWNDSNKIIKDDKLPIDIVAGRKYPPGTTDFHAELTAVKAAKPDGLFAVDFTVGTSEIYIQGQRDVGLNTVYVAVEVCEGPEFYTLLKKWGDHQLLESKFGPFAGPPYYLPLMDTYIPKFKQKFGVFPGMMGADTYDAIYIAKDAIERAGTLDKAKVRDALETTKMKNLLILTETGYIEFGKTPETYHEISPATFIEQLIWDEKLGECRPFIVWPEKVPNVGTIKQRDFKLPPLYTPGEK
ncbi:MAG: ABC transporter substrate-binding protein [Candidatus Bathyarchaeia archaeon]